MQKEGLQSTQQAEIMQKEGLQSTQQAEIMQKEGLQSTQQAEIMQKEGLQSTQQAEIMQKEGLQSTQQAEIMQKAEKMQRFKMTTLRLCHLDPKLKMIRSFTLLHWFQNALGMFSNKWMSKTMKDEETGE